jgi:hypothetical protein
MSWSETMFDEAPAVEPSPSNSSRRPSWAPGAVLWALRQGKKWIPCRRTGCEAKILFVESPRGNPTPIECVGKYPDGTPIFELHADNCVDAGNTGGFDARVSHRTTPYRRTPTGPRRREQSMF